MSAIRETTSSSTGLSATTARSGFITVYAVILLMATITITSAVAGSLVKYYRFSSQLEELRKMNWAEVIAICHVKQQFRTYQEEDETFEIGDCLVTTVYDDLTCYIEINGPTLSRSRVLVFDDINDIVEDYY